MNFIYVCSPYRGDVERNTAFARACCSHVCDTGGVPVAPHLYFTQFLDDTDEEQRHKGLKIGLELIGACNEVWVFGQTISSGMRAEIEHAEKLGKVVRYVDR